MIICEHCGTIYQRSAACPSCGHVNADPGWEGIDRFDEDPTSDAIILGDLLDEWGEGSLTPGVAADEAGNSKPAAYYAARDPSQMLSEDAVPVLNPFAKASTPFEEMIISWINGKKTVAEIARERGMSLGQWSATLIALSERAVISFRDQPAEVSEEMTLSESTSDGPETPDAPEPVFNSEDITQREFDPSLPTLPPEDLIPLDALSKDDPSLSTPKAMPVPVPLKPPKRTTLPPPPPPKPTLVGRGKADQKLYEQALADKAAGNFVSALTNIKLALVFAKSNPDYLALCEEMQQRVTEMTHGSSPVARAAALFEQAARKEKDDVDAAIALLEEALKLSKDPQYYNRLGVILAIRKHEVARGRELIAKALALAPTNRTYKANLEKVDDLIADQNPPSPGRRARSLFGKKS